VPQELAWPFLQALLGFLLQPPLLGLTFVVPLAKAKQRGKETAPPQTNALPSGLVD
jgi:hypothetical protein